MSAAPFTLIVVEDDLVDATAVRRAAARRHPQIPVVVHPTAAAALADPLLAAGASEPVLVLVDINLPGTGGHELVRRLRRGACPPPILMLTTSADRHDQATARHNGAAGYFLKPIEADEWPHLIGTILEYWSLSQWHDEQTRSATP